MAITFNQGVFSQINNNIIKYWYYRNRLQYFVVPGEKQGESQIICVRNKIYIDPASNDPNPAGRKNADYGQPGMHTGYYLGTLATEYYLLNKNGQYEDAAKTAHELYMALYAIQEFWDKKAEDYWLDKEHNNIRYSEHYNGIRIRGNVPCVFYYVTLHNA